MAENDEEQQEEFDEIADDGAEMIEEKRRYLPLASSFCFDVSSRPAQATDKYSPVRLCAGILVGCAIIFLAVAPGFISPAFKTDVAAGGAAENASEVSWLFVVLGALLILRRLPMFFSKREFLIGNSVTSIVIQRPFEKKIRKSAPLSAYVGVRDRTRMVNWYGLISRTQHIIDLQHPDETKTIPLYVSYDGTGINDRWVRYAQLLKMPALFYTADECINVPLDDIQTSHPDLIKRGIIEIDEEGLYKLPQCVKINENDKYCRIGLKMRDGAFTLFAALLCLFSFFTMAGVSVVLSSYQHWNVSVLLSLLSGASLLLIVVPAAMFFRRRRLIVSNEGIRIQSVWLGFPSFGELIKPEELEYVKVVQSSHDKKHSVVIGANGQTTYVGRGAKKADLEWLCNFLNAKIRQFMN